METPPAPAPAPPAPVEPAPAPKPEPAPPAPVPAPVPAPAAKSGEAALGAVKGGESGGKKLAAETVSAETLDFLKNYNQ